MARNSHSHRHTRLVNYKPKRHRRPIEFRPWFFIPISAVLAFVLAIVLGNVLRVKVPDKSPEETTPQRVETQNPNVSGPISIKAPCVTLSGITDNTAANVGKQIPLDASAVSMILFDKSGTPYYKSEVAEAFGNPCGDLTLRNVFRPIQDNDLYASVVFPSSLFNEYDELKAAVIGAYEATLIDELNNAGADEVVICFSTLGKDEPLINGEGIFEKIEAYVSAIRLKNSNVRVGIALTLDDILNSDNAAVVERLSRTADFCTVDFTAAESEEEFSSAVYDVAVTILRLEMRLILSEAGRSEEFLAAAYEALEKFGINNLQYIG